MNIICTYNQAYVCVPALCRQVISLFSYPLIPCRSLQHPLQTANPPLRMRSTIQDRCWSVHPHIALAGWLAQCPAPPYSNCSRACVLEQGTFSSCSGRLLADPAACSCSQLTPFYHPRNASMQESTVNEISSSFGSGLVRAVWTYDCQGGYVSLARPVSAICSPSWRWPKRFRPWHHPYRTELSLLRLRCTRGFHPHGARG